MPTAAHVIYIPSMFMLGLVVGYILGGRAATAALLAQQARKEARAARQAERKQRSQAAQDALTPSPQPDSGEQPGPPT